MKTVIFAAPLLFFSTVSCVDLSHQPIKIQSLVKKLFNLKPDPYRAHNLAQPVDGAIKEEQIDVDSKEVSDVFFKFKNVTIFRHSDGGKNLSNRYTLLVCDFEQQLSISRWVDPPNLEIHGIYDIEHPAKSSKPSQFFIVKQFDGRLTYKVNSNNTNDIDLVYSDQELKLGESNKNHISLLRAIGVLVDDVINRTVVQLNQKHNLTKKIQDFAHVFPFLSDCVHPVNKTMLRLQDENTYSINNTIAEQWENVTWILPYVLIRGLNNFKQVRIMATEAPTNNGIRFNMTIVTKKLSGQFEWSYGINGQVLVSNQMKNFTIDNLTLTANVGFGQNWFIDKVDIELGLINLVNASKQKHSETLPDINVFAYDIFYENLQMLIKTHLKQLIHEEYSPQMTTTRLNTTAMAANSSNQTVIKMASVITTAQSKNVTPCIDDRRWWQKIYKSNKCKGDNSTATTSIPAQTALPMVKSNTTNTTNQNGASLSNLNTNLTSNTTSLPKTSSPCIDDRRWWQKIYKRNKCKGDNSTATTSIPAQTTTTLPIIKSKTTNTTNQNGMRLSNLNTNLTSITKLLPPTLSPCIDDRRWWQVFRRNKCKDRNSTTLTSIKLDQKNIETDKCVDTRWFFQKPFIRNKCKPKDKI